MSDNTPNIAGQDESLKSKNKGDDVRINDNVSQWAAVLTVMTLTIPSFPG